MEGFSISVFKLTLGWSRNVVQTVWNGIFDPLSGGFVSWIGDHWLLLFLILCITGAVLDLLVYFFRWRPLQVWKSYFRRRKLRKNGGISPTSTHEESDGERTGGEYQPVFAANAYHDEPYTAIETEKSPATETDDLERWREPENEPYPEDTPDEITPAGYSVPMDSPYRRPAADRRPDIMHEYAGRNPDLSGGRRRRRRSISGLFGGDEDEIQLYEPPQPVIDSREAYHAPVYPKNWTGDGDPTS